MVDSQLTNALVEQIARRLDRNVVLDDAHNQLLAYCTVAETVDRARYYHLLMKTSVPEVHMRQAEATTHLEPFLLPPEPEAGFFGRLGIPLIRRDRHLGTLWVQACDDEDSLADSMRLLPDIEDYVVQLRRHLSETSLLEPHTRGTHPELVEALRRDDEDRVAQILRGRLFGRYAVIVILPVFPARHADSSGERRQALSRVISAVGGSMAVGFAGSADEDHAACFVPASQVEKEGLVDDLLRATRETMTCRDVGIGISSPAEPGGFAQVAYRQAVVAAQAHAVDPAYSPYWPSMGIYRTLAAWPLGPEGGSQRLQQLRDSSDGEVLTATLEAVYDASGPRSEVAKALHLHRATLYNRLARIEGIIGADPLDSAVRLDLHLWMKASRWARRPLL